MTARTRLTPGLAGQIVAGVRAGSFPRVAAQAFGVAPAVLDDWLRRGHGPRARGPYAAFASDFAQALAQARLRAEMAVFNDEPKVWLQHGPGREQPDGPGWTAVVRPGVQAARSEHALMDPWALKIMGVIMDEPTVSRALRENLSGWVREGKDLRAAPLAA